MRLLIIFIITLFFGSTGIAQNTWQSIGDILYYQGPVGIGTPYATERLEVDGNIKATAFYTPGTVMGSQTPTVPYRNAASTIGTYNDSQSLYLQSPNELYLHAGTTKDTISTMTLRDNRVGIGTDFPERALHIRGTNDGEDDIIMESEGGGHPNNSSALLFRRSNLEQAPVQDGDLLGLVNFSGYDGEDYQYSAAVASFARSNYEDEVNADFRVINTYKGELHESMRINPNGSFQVAPLIIPAGPATSGSIPSTGLVARWTNKGGATLDHGMYLDGRQWLQGTNVGNQAAVYSILLNPNGGNIGIGTDVPHAPLHIHTHSPDRGLQISTTGIQGSILLHMASGGYGVLSLGGNTKLRGNGRGSSFEGPLAIQTTNNSYSLHVNGNAGKPGGGSWINVSDKRLKKNIKDYEDGLDELMQIRPVRYQYNGKLDLPSDEEYVGIIAQEMQEVAPYMVGTFQDEEKGEEYLDFDGSALTFMLVNAVQEQQTQIEALAEENQSLRADNEAIKEEVATLKQMVQQLVQTQITTNTQTSKLSDAVLEQNNPNPFSESTSIQYFIPQATKSAVLHITAIDGKALKQIPITARGYGQTLLEASALGVGTYTYSLILDGQLFETKQMILTNQ